MSTAVRSSARIAIVLPRHVLGTSVSAGAERLGGTIAHSLAERGHSVEILTTTALDWRQAKDAFEQGEVREGKVVVRRFGIDWSSWRRAQYQAAVHRWSGTLGAADSSDEDMLIQAMPHAPALYDYIDRAAAQYDALLFLPYLAPTTICGMSLCAERACLMPCLHDEPFARAAIVRALFQSAHSVLFLSGAERHLAEHDLGYRMRRAAVVGAGVVDRSAQACPERFRRRLGWQGRIVLYSGRIEAAKNVYALLSGMDTFVSESGRNDVLLVLRGTHHSPIAPRPYVRVLPPEGEFSYLDAYAAASVHVHPSMVESFSLSLMEGWLAGKPALVHAQCAVTRAHVKACDGGLWFGNRAEFSAALSWLLEHPAEAAQMGQNGRAYVLSHYRWEHVLPQLEQALLA
ncbi:MAG: glycosyltransferase family 4 protein [Anaerolineae bacterium]|nr:glycosyltransferase family 4 protein [Anaerolineae bacterium]